MELQTATKHMLIDVQDTTRLSLGGTEDIELIIMPEERLPIATIPDSMQVLESDLTPHAGKERNDIRGGPN